MNQQILAEVETKVWWHSRTVWFNVVSFILVILGIVLESTGALGISSKGVAWIGLVIAIGNAWLRFSTNQPISTRRGDTAVVTTSETTPYISNHMLHEENVDLAEKLNAIEGYLRDSWNDPFAARRRSEPDDPELILPRALTTELEQR